MLFDYLQFMQLSIILVEILIKYLKIRLDRSQIDNRRIQITFQKYYGVLSVGLTKVHTNENITLFTIHVSVR